MADFDFNSGDNSTEDKQEQQSVFDFSSAKAPAPKDGRIRVEFSDDDLAHISELASQRNKSYANGETGRNRDLKDDSEGCHSVGLRAEYAISKLYEEAEVDTEIYTHGDDGVDATFTLGGEERAVDVKGNTYRRNGNPDSTDLWVESDKKKKTNIDAFVVVYVPENDESYAEVLGWVPRERVFKSENKSKSPYGHYNYEVEGGSFNTMPQPTTERGEWIQ